MKYFPAFVLLAISASALPQAPERNVVTDLILDAVEDVSQSIKDAGLDPLQIKRESVSYALPVPVIFNAAAFCEEVLSTGLSNILVTQINYNVLTFRLTFVIEVPHIHISAGIAAGEAVLFGNRISAEGGGSLDIYNIRVGGDVRVGIIGGITVRELQIDFALGGINSQINLIIQETDLSNVVNNAVNEVIPAILDEFKNEINELISIIVMDIINDRILN